MTIKLPIYMDYQATTPCDPRVVEKMLPYFTKKFGNAGSFALADNTHTFGHDAKNAVEKARIQIANLINALPEEIIFTSGATESNNLAIQGAAEFANPFSVNELTNSKSSRGHIITVATEHKCVINTVRYLQTQGFEVTILPVKKNGLLDLDLLQKTIQADSILVSVMHANNEIGVIQDIAKIGEICRQNDVKFHSDCAQSFGKIPLDVKAMNLDMASISSHKIYGPKGVGALFVSRKPKMRLRPIIHGGGQERGLRSGTLPVPLIVGFGEAAEIAQNEMTSEAKCLTKLCEKLHQGIVKNIPNIEINGSMDSRLPGNLNVSFAYIEGESLMMAIKDLAVSSGSACTSESLEPSYVLRALGVGDESAHSSIRFGLGRFSTEEEVDYAVKILTEKVAQLRDLSPLWEMAQEGIDISKIEWNAH